MSTTTTVNFNTSGFVGTSGITWMEAIYNGNLASPTNLISGSGSMTLTDGSVSSGRIYILAGSGTAPTFTSESQIVSLAPTDQYRYIVYELNLGNNQSDVLDITAINGIGFNTSAQSVETSGPNYNSGALVPFSGSSNSLTSQITSAPISNSSAVQTNAANGYNQIYGPSGGPGDTYWLASNYSPPAAV